MTAWIGTLFFTLSQRLKAVVRPIGPLPLEMIFGDLAKVLRVIDRPVKQPVQLWQTGGRAKPRHDAGKGRQAELLFHLKMSPLGFAPRVLQGKDLFDFGLVLLRAHRGRRRKQIDRMDRVGLKIAEFIVGRP